MAYKLGIFHLTAQNSNSTQCPYIPVSHALIWLMHGSWNGLMVSDASSSAEKNETNAGEEIRDKEVPAKQQWSQLLLTCACLMMLELSMTYLSYTAITGNKRQNLQKPHLQSLCKQQWGLTHVPGMTRRDSFCRWQSLAIWAKYHHLEPHRRRKNFDYPNSQMQKNGIRKKEAWNYKLEHNPTNYQLCGSYSHRRERAIPKSLHWSQLWKGKSNIAILQFTGMLADKSFCGFILIFKE